MPHVATSPADLLATMRPAAHLDGDRLVIDDVAAFRDESRPASSHVFVTQIAVGVKPTVSGIVDGDDIHLAVLPGLVRIVR